AYAMRQFAFIYHVRAEITFIYRALLTWYTGIIWCIISFLNRIALPGIRPVEHPDRIRTCRHAKPATDATVVIDQHNAISAFEGGIYWTNLNAGRFIAVLTQSRLPVRCRFFRILHFVNLDPRIFPRDVMVLVART